VPRWAVLNSGELDRPQAIELSLIRQLGDVRPNQSRTLGELDSNTPMQGVVAHLSAKADDKLDRGF